MDLKSFLKDKYQDRQLSTYNENAIKQTIILPILQYLGWNIFSLNEVIPEYSCGSDKVDYALQYGSKNYVFIEVKRPNLSLDKYQEQLLKYSFHSGVRLSVLTNGINWWFYLPLQEGHWESRKFFSINLLEQKLEDTIKRLNDFLNRDNVVNGSAESLALEVLNSKARKENIKKAIPNAWYSILEEPDELLVDLLKERVETISGYTPYEEEITNFIREIFNGREFGSERLNEKPTKEQNNKNNVGITRDNENAYKEEHATIKQNDLYYEIIEALQYFDGRAPKQHVVDYIHEKFKNEFEKAWQNESVSYGIPRWQHNIAWAKESLKRDGLIKPPKESGRNIWELTDVGKRKNIRL